MVAIYQSTIKVGNRNHCARQSAWHLGQYFQLEYKSEHSAVIECYSMLLQEFLWPDTVLMAVLKASM